MALPRWLARVNLRFSNVLTCGTEVLELLRVAEVVELREKG